MLGRLFIDHSRHIFPRKGLLQGEVHLARMFHESPAATTDMAVLPGVLGCLALATWNVFGLRRRQLLFDNLWGN
jgi:hypothetical protein